MRARADCLEFFSVATRLPPEYRLTPADGARLLEEEVFARLAVHDLPARDRLPMLVAVARDGIAGGRVYDAHITEVARAAGAAVVVPTTAGISCRIRDPGPGTRDPGSGIRDSR